MFFTYLRRELAGRRKQTAIVAAGIALAIALVIIVNSVSAGVKDAQTTVLDSVYGVGTDITVSSEPAAPAEGGRPGGGPGRFQFDDDDGESDGETRTINQSRLTTGFGGSTLDASALDSVAAIDGVAGATAALALTNVNFSGELPDRSQIGQGAPPDGGQSGGPAFDVDTVSVLGVDASADALGPLAAVSLDGGRALVAGDAGLKVAVVDAAYATSAEVAIDDTIDIGGSKVTIVGIVSSNAADADSPADVYVPLDVAQSLAGLDGQVSDVYVQATSSDVIGEVQAGIEAALPDTTVSTQADLAANVSGSLSSASDLVSGLGKWVSIAALLAAFLLAVLLTISGVTRRTREFGTLKALGWSNRRVVGQVSGEAVVQGLIGGAVGVALGLAGVGIINVVGPTLSGAASENPLAAADGPPGGFGGGRAGGLADLLETPSAAVKLVAPFAPSVLVTAVVLALLGGLLAGVLGGWRASRLRPAEALRSVA